jgi:dihydroxyacetone kinase-like predicted kinase
MAKFTLEFILSVPSASPQMIKNSIVEFGSGLEIIQLLNGDTVKGRDFKIHVQTDDPTLIFDTCAQFGRIKSVKIEEA